MPLHASDQDNLRSFYCLYSPFILYCMNEKIFQQNKYPYCRNIESFRQKGKKQNININTPKVGEIDFIIVNKKQ